jgi:hypothetical protein
MFFDENAIFGLKKESYVQLGLQKFHTPSSVPKFI